MRSNEHSGNLLSRTYKVAEFEEKNLNDQIFDGDHLAEAVRRNKD